MSRNYSIIEPHPTVPKSGAYLHVGRGGAGNVRKFKSEEITLGPNASGPASRTTLQKATQRLARTGRGGAGNYGTPSNNTTDEGIFQFDEEMLKKREPQPAPVYHVGRGGAGNLFWERPAGSSERKDSSSSSSSESERITAMRRRDSGGVLSIFSRRSA